MKKIFLLFGLLLLLACQEKTSEPAPTQPADKFSFSDKLQVTSNRTVTLLPEARQEVGEWLAYATAQDEVESLKGKTGSQIAASSKSLVQIMESLKSSLPDTLKTPAVEARINVLLTKAKILHQLASKKEKRPSEIFDVANEIIIEFDNFKLQLNELFLKTPSDFETELDKEFEEATEADSLPYLPRELE